MLKQSKKEFYMPFIAPVLISFLTLLPMGFFYFVVGTKQNFIDVGLFFFIAGLKGILYPFLFHKLKLNTPSILLLGVLSSIFVFFISTFMTVDSSGFIRAGTVAVMYLIVFIPCYLISTFLQLIVLKKRKQ